MRHRRRAAPAAPALPPLCSETERIVRFLEGHSDEELDRIVADLKVFILILYRRCDEGPADDRPDDDGLTANRRCRATTARAAPGGTTLLPPPLWGRSRRSTRVGGEDFTGARVAPPPTLTLPRKGEGTGLARQ